MESERDLGRTGRMNSADMTDAGDGPICSYCLFHKFLSWEVRAKYEEKLSLWGS